MDERLGQLLGAIRRDVQRNLLRARNGIKVAAGTHRDRFGKSPKDTVWRNGKVELWRYHNDSVTQATPILLVFSLVTRSYLLDLRPGQSVVEFLCSRGFDVYLLDWGVADASDAGNTLDTYTHRYLPDAVEAVLETSDADDVTLLGYCLGGVIALIATAAHPELPVRNLVTMATPVDFHQIGGVNALFNVMVNQMDIELMLDETGNVPPELIVNAFTAIKPTAPIVNYANLWQHLWNDEYVDGYQAMAQWTHDHVPFPGACFRQLAHLLGRDNALMNGTLALQGRPVDLRAVTCPVLNVIAETDHVVPVAAATPVTKLVGSAATEELTLPAGHIALTVGRQASKVTLPHIADWLERHSS